MDKGKQIGATEGDATSQVDTTRNPTRLIETEIIRRRGGHVSATIGWSGLARELINKLLGFLISGPVWVLIIFVAYTLADENLRIQARTWWAGPTTTAPNEAGNKLPILESESYEQLPQRWKKALAEVQLSQSSYPARFVTIVSELTAEDMEKIDHIAVHAIGGMIIRNNKKDNDHDIATLNSMDFSRLKAMGILTEGQFGQQLGASPRRGEADSRVLRGTTLAMRITAPDPETELNIPVTVLTQEGRLLIDMLSRRNSLQGLCVSATQLKEAGWKTVIAAHLEPEGHPWSGFGAITVTDLCPNESG